VKYKVPKHVEFVAELPKSAVGKILRKELKKLDQETSKVKKGNGSAGGGH